MIGFNSESNFNRGSTVTILDFLENYKNKKDIQIIDVRNKEEFENGNLENSINISVDNMRSSLDKIDKDKEIFVYCQAGFRGYLAERILSQNGFKVKNIQGNNYYC